MMASKKLFVCEFITGGGLLGEELPEHLALEGRLMRDALLDDLNLSGRYRLYTTCDARVMPYANVEHTLQVEASMNVWDIWKNLIDEVELVWIIAPESNGCLERLTDMVLRNKKQLLGSDTTAVRLTASKMRTANHLAAVGLYTTPSRYFSDWRDIAHEDAWVVKPDDGVGCESTYYFDHPDTLTQWFADSADRRLSYVIQPYVKGIPASISVLMSDHGARLLSCNLQSIEVCDGQLMYKGGCVNGLSEAYWPSLQIIADAIKHAIPGLKGYVGVDLVIGASIVTVIEINPRLTTSYIHLRTSLQVNPATCIIDALTLTTFEMPRLSRQPITFEVHRA